MQTSRDSYASPELQRAKVRSHTLQSRR